MSTALDFFKLFFTEELLQELVTTNVSLEEIKAFIGIIINIGLHDVPDMKDFFSQQWEFYIPFFSYIMSRMRFFRYFEHFMQESLNKDSLV